jgi:hypothetical protein
VSGCHHDPWSPSAQSPFARFGCYPLLGVLSGHLGERYPSFIALTGSRASPPASSRFQPRPIRQVFDRLLPAPAGRWTFPTLSSQSLQRRLDPCPAVSLQCTCPFLPEGHRPSLRPDPFGTPSSSCIAASAWPSFQGCSHSFMFSLLCSLGPQTAPTAPLARWAAGPYTPRIDHGLPLMTCGIATCLNRAIGRTGLPPAGLWSCRLLPGPEGFHTYLE